MSRLLGAMTVMLVCAASPLALAHGSDLLLQEDFGGPLDEGRWEVARAHDVRREQVAVVGGRLALGLDTLGTDDATVKLRGVATRQAFEVSPGAGVRVSLTIDWNAPENGCYLTAGLALVPDGAALDPRAADEALCFEWVGVPPGRHARPYLWRRARGAPNALYTEGWPQPRREDRVGRPVGRTRITLEVGATEVRLVEDGVERFRGEGGLAGRLRLFLFVTSHSNYPERIVLMDDVRVERLE